MRVRRGRAWGFAPRASPRRAAAERALARALALAEAQPRAPGAALAPVPPARGHWAGPCERDPFAMPLEEQVSSCCWPPTRPCGRDARIVHARAHGNGAAHRTRRSPPPRARPARRTAPSAGGGISAVAVEGAARPRSAPIPSPATAGTAAAGWELRRSASTSSARRRASPRRRSRSSPPRLPGRRHDRDPPRRAARAPGPRVDRPRAASSTACSAHEAVATPARAGSTPDDLGSLRYGSEALNVTADATLPGGLGSFGWDDEGVRRARSRPLMRDGVLRATLSSRESAAADRARRVGRLRARRRAHPPADRAHDQRVARARGRRVASPT